MQGIYREWGYIRIGDMINRIICWLIGHNDWNERIEYDVQYGSNKFVSIWMCRRCKRQWWIKGYVCGRLLRGGRFVNTQEEDKDVQYRDKG
jgi:hypothetical protein